MPACHPTAYPFCSSGVMFCMFCLSPATHVWHRQHKSQVTVLACIRAALFRPFGAMASSKSDCSKCKRLFELKNINQLLQLLYSTISIAVLLAVAQPGFSYVSFSIAGVTCPDGTFAEGYSTRSSCTACGAGTVWRSTPMFDLVKPNPITGASRTNKVRGNSSSCCECCQAVIWQQLQVAV